MLRRIKAFLKEDQDYFYNSRTAIMTQNTQMLVKGCIAYAAVLMFYTLVTNLTAEPVVLRSMYYVFDLIHVMLCICVFRYVQRKSMDYGKTQVLCALFEIALLAFFALEGAYTSRTEHSLYIPIAILMFLLVFIHKALYTNILIAVYIVSYGVLSCLYKTPEAYINDINVAVATWISATIGYILLAQMRHREGAALSRFEALSRTDQLTGLLNKAAIIARCEQIVLEMDAPCVFMILDLDNFKHVNDVYGHAAGDEVLQAVGMTLKRNFRDRDFIGRFGGDEFIILMNQCDDRDIIRNRVEKVIEQIAALHFSEPTLSVQCSVGITMKRVGDSFQELFERADRALYAAKGSGKGKYRAAEWQV